MIETVLAFARALAWGQLPSAYFKIVGLLFVFGGVGAFVFESSTDPRGAARRAAATYVAGLDGHFKSMFLPARGAYVAWLQLCGAIALLATYGFVHNAALPYGAALVLLVPPIAIGIAAKRRRRVIDNQVNGFALALANALKTTASIGDALWVTLGVTAKPIRQELELALKQVRIGSTIEEALLAMSARSQSVALDVVVSALLIGRQTGGDLPRILEVTAASLRELKRLEEMTDRIMRSAKQSLAFASCIVAALAFSLPKIVPGFFDPLRDTVKGQVIVLQCALVFSMALFLGYRFTRSDI